jgi:hypothetical protein
MIENKKDREATKALRREGKIVEYGSYVSYAGHLYLTGKDRSALRQRVMQEAHNKCAICGEPCPGWDGDLEHIVGGRPVARCDCFNQQLANGKIHTNVQWVHGMFSRSHACHRNKHNREPRWSDRSSKA